MSTASLAKTLNEQYRDLWTAYQAQFSGPFRAEDVIEWGYKNGLIDDLPRIDQRRIRKQQLKRAMRAERTVDPQGRKVRSMLPAKYKRPIDENGNFMIDVEWDHVHHMSLDHAHTSFAQCDENLGKQERAAKRNAESFLDNNPNAQGHRDEFQYLNFMRAEEHEPQAVETIEETKKLAQQKPR